MIPIAAAATIAPAIAQMAKILTGAIEDGDNYKRLDAVRGFVEKVTGKEIPKGAFIAFLEEATQGEPYTGKWVLLDPEFPEAGQRLRVEAGWIYDIGRGNPLFVKDA